MLSKYFTRHKKSRWGTLQIWWDEMDPEKVNKWLTGNVDKWEIAGEGYFQYITLFKYIRK